jgi:hypothetical protein
MTFITWVREKREGRREKGEEGKIKNQNHSAKLKIIQSGSLVFTF